MVLSVPDAMAVQAVGYRCLIQERNLEITRVFRNAAWTILQLRISSSRFPTQVCNMTDHLAAASTKDTITLELSDLSLANAEATLIHRVLQETGWNLNRAARRLEIARGTLYSKIKKYHIGTDMRVIP